jgi:hypothetical protein
VRLLFFLLAETYRVRVQIHAPDFEDYPFASTLKDILTLKSDIEEDTHYVELMKMWKVVKPKERSLTRTPISDDVIKRVVDIVRDKRSQREQGVLSSGEFVGDNQLWTNSLSHLGWPNLKDAISGARRFFHGSSTSKDDDLRSLNWMLENNQSKVSTNLE